MSKSTSDLFEPRSDLGKHLFRTPTPPGYQTLLTVPAYTPFACITVSGSSPPAITTASLLITQLTTVVSVTPKVITVPSTTRITQ